MTSVYQSLVRDGWSYYEEKDPEQPFAEFLKERHACVRAAMILSIIESQVDNGGFDQLFHNYALDKDSALVDLFIGTLLDMKARLGEEKLPGIVVILWDNAGVWYRNAHEDRDEKMNDLDQRFYDVCGPAGVEWRRCVEAYLFLIEQDHGAAHQKS